MRPIFIAVSKYVYKLIHISLLKDLIYNIFAFLVRNIQKDVTIDGIKYHLDLGERIDLSIYLQSYEKDICHAIDKFCEKGWIAADIGANIGVHTLRLAGNVGPSGRVFAFEPTSYAYNKLCKNVSLNKFDNISLHKIALSSNNAKNNEIRFKSSWPTYGRPTEYTDIVDFERFDDWCQVNNLERVDIMKIDVDGNENAVLLGAKKVLSEYNPLILIEIGLYHFVDETTNPLLLLRGLNYKFWNINTFIEYNNIDEIQQVFHSSDNIDSVNIIAAKMLNIAN
jgi:FkbM family methyltransferase